MVYDIHIVFDCKDVDKVSRFWLTALEGYNYPGSPPDQPPGSPPEGFASWEAWADANAIPADRRYAVRTIIDTVGSRPDIFFIAVPEGKVVKNRVHLDIKASDGLPPDQVRGRQEAEAERLTAAGAAMVARVEGIVVMQDVEGNEFCIT
ncbi:VOC family protein [Actinopolymorpha sp. B11F2]|uniref:VOC family protein n=1 Tax=Actinopolymorpha sp. B11F2 TaxID=3160862 RepID=UPI0032E3F79B